MMPLVTAHAHAIIIWGCVIGSIAVWIVCELLHARQPAVLPEPQADERDSMQRWREICDSEES